MNKMSKNMLASMIYIVVSMLTNFVIQQRILVAYGSSINGISSSVTQFLSYLTLLEAGLGAASIQALYKPLSTNFWGEINSILSATRRQYNKIGLFFGLLLLLFSGVLAAMVSGQLGVLFVILFTVISGLNTLFSYVLVGKYNVFLNANQKISVIYIVDAIMLILGCAAKIGAIKMGLGILVVQFLSAVFTAVKAFVLYIYIRKKYRQLDMRVEPDYTKLEKRKSVMIHSIAGLVVNHTDVTLLTAFSSLKNVSLYSIYNLIYNSISLIANTVFANATQGTFGYLATKEKELYRKYYYAFEFLYSILLYSILTIALILTLPFISIYTKSVTDFNYISRSIAVLFCVNMFMSLVRIPSIVTIKAYGLFKETQKGALIEAVINIVVSLALLPFMGIQGLLIGTFCSYLFRTQDTVLYVYKYLKMSKRFLIKNNIINVLIALLFSAVFLIWKPIEVSGWLSWLGVAVIVSLLIFATFVAVNLIFNFKVFKQSVSLVIKKIKK